MIAYGVEFGGLKAFALHGADVEKLRPIKFFHIFQCLHQTGQVVSIQRANIMEAQFPYGETLSSSPRLRMLGQGLGQVLLPWRDHLALP